MSEDRDELLDRIVGALRPLPEGHAEAKARVLIAVAAERERVRRSPARATQRGRMTRWIAGAAGLAAAAVVAAILLLQPSRSYDASVGAGSSSPAVRVAAVAVADSVARLASRDPAGDAASALQPIQLVFRAPTATTVRVVGDFNSWDGEHAPMTRDPRSGLWSATLSLRPGRHVYAFLVDDTLLVRDPRALAARDADFGRPGSVLLVGRP